MLLFFFLFHLGRGEGGVFPLPRPPIKDHEFYRKPKPYRSSLPYFLSPLGWGGGGVFPDTRLPLKIINSTENLSHADHELYRT